jgi:hypothetical protein
MASFVALVAPSFPPAGTAYATATAAQTAETWGNAFADGTDTAVRQLALPVDAPGQVRQPLLVLIDQLAVAGLICGAAFGEKSGEKVVVQRILALHRADTGYTAIANQLNEAGHRTLIGKLFRPQTVKNYVLRYGGEGKGAAAEGGR